MGRKRRQKIGTLLLPALWKKECCSEVTQWRNFLILNGMLKQLLFSTTPGTRRHRQRTKRASLQKKGKWQADEADTSKNVKVTRRDFCKRTVTIRPSDREMGTSGVHTTAANLWSFVNLTRQTNEER